MVASFVTVWVVVLVAVVVVVLTLVTVVVAVTVVLLVGTAGQSGFPSPMYELAAPVTVTIPPFAGESAAARPASPRAKSPVVLENFISVLMRMHPYYIDSSFVGRLEGKEWRVGFSVAYPDNVMRD